MDTRRVDDFDALFFTEVFNRLQTNIYILDAETETIVYMNDAMKREFRLEHPEGKPCWQLLQEGMTGKCPFCSRKDREAGCPPVVWDEKNTKTGRVYRHYDNWTEWNGKRYYVSEFTDVTEYTLLSRCARFDDLTGIHNRRAGREMLAERMETGRKENAIITVALMDVNELKKINDRYGHAKGDQLLSCLADAVRECLKERDMVFRMGGDEFVLAFYGVSLSEAEARIREIEDRFRKAQEKDSRVQQVSFSAGLTEVYPGDRNSILEIIRQADEKMYLQKRDYHIRRAKEELLTTGGAGETADTFRYDKDHLYDALSASTDDYVFVGNMKTGVFRYPPAMVKEFGLPGEIVENAAAFWSGMIHPDDEKGFLESNQDIADGRVNSHNIEYRARNTRGEWIWLRCRGRMLKDSQGRPDLFAGLITNLGKVNRTDHMTGLFNRFAFEGNIKKYLADHEKRNRMDVMILDMDSFKNVNDLYDRAFGDGVLRTTAQKISQMLSPNASIYRLDGDEFGILILNGEEREAQKIFGGIQNKFCRQQEYNGKKYYCTISAGCAVYPSDADNYLDLLKFANYSLEHSKQKGKNRMTLFSVELIREKERSLEFTELLRESIEHGFTGFSVSYQPQVYAETGEICGAEALARWHCPKYGDISPVEFIPLLEQSGLIIPMGSWILYHAVEQCGRWRKRKPDFHISVNLSYRQLLEGDIVEGIRETLEILRMPPEGVILELTETYLMKDAAGTRDILDKMKQAGIMLAMDDFGIGYSSLFSLKSTPVDVVKIDRGFVKGITTDLFNATFVKAITELCHDVGKKVCLEGVESREEYEVVKGMGLELIQGYYFGKPVRAEVFEEQWLS